MKSLLYLFFLLPLVGLSQDSIDSWTWRQRSSTSAPSPRQGASIVWTGRELLVCYGYDGDDRGGRYDPARDVWTSMSTSNAPSVRAYQTAIAGQVPS